MNRNTILLVEDDEETRQTIELILTDFGFDVISDPTGENIYNLLQHHSPAIVILDIVLPNADGREICRTLKANPLYRNLPVIMISGHTELYNSITHFGANDVITKPFDGSILMNRIVRQLENSKKPHHLDLN